MEFPTWFQQAIQQRLDVLSARLDNNPKLHKHREEDNAVLQAIATGLDESRRLAFLEWEDKSHFTQALTNEHLYLQGMRDGAKLVLTLLTDQLSSGDGVSNSSKSPQPHQRSGASGFR